MNALGAASDLDEFDLDVLGQQLQINRLYTQNTLCFELPNDSTSLQPQISTALSRGIKRLSASLPWVAGKVVNLHGTFKIQSSQKTPPLVVKDYRNDPSLPSWEALQEADFPFRMLDENLIAPCKTLAVSDSELPVFLIQANFITGGLLLTFNGQHGSMDMTGQGQVMYLVAKACRNESFTPLELSVGNMDRRSVVPVLNDYCLELEPDQQNQKDIPHGGA
jgi:trichothecene 3-O-acetyltransferase